MSKCQDTVTDDFFFLKITNNDNISNVHFILNYFNSRCDGERHAYFITQFFTSDFFSGGASFFRFFFFPSERGGASVASLV